jgi:hypothetical protein
VKRSDRKARQRALFAQLDAAQAQERARKEQWAREHPVSAGLIPVEQYREPKWGSGLL